MLVDDHLIVRMGLSFALNNEPDFEVIAQAEDGLEASEMYREHRPDVVVLDLRMPKRNGIQTISALRREFPGARILVMSNYGGGDEVAAALEAGAAGFIGKDTNLAGLLAAIRKVRDGEAAVATELAQRLASKVSSHLSAKEMQVLTLIAKGYSNKQVATAMNVVESTVKVHVTNILLKLHASDRTQAVLVGIKRGLIHLE